MRLWPLMALGAVAATAVWAATQSGLRDAILFHFDQSLEPRRVGHLDCPDKPVTLALVQALEATPVIAGTSLERTEPPVRSTIGEPVGETAEALRSDDGLPPEPSADLVDRVMLALVPVREGSGGEEPSADARRDGPALRVHPDLLLARGNALLGSGDIASARLFFRLAVEQGDREATTQLAKTFDPLWLQGSGARAMRGDHARSALLYEMAAARGDHEAERRLAALRLAFP